MQDGEASSRSELAGNQTQDIPPSAPRISLRTRERRKAQNASQKAADLPPRDEELSDEQIDIIITQNAKIRANHGRYFSTRGLLRANWRPLLFKKDSHGKYIHDEKIITSNLGTVLLHTYEAQHPDSSRSELFKFIEEQSSGMKASSKTPAQPSVIQPANTDDLQEASPEKGAWSPLFVNEDPPVETSVDSCAPVIETPTLNHTVLASSYIAGDHDFCATKTPVVDPMALSGTIAENHDAQLEEQSIKLNSNLASTDQLMLDIISHANEQQSGFSQGIGLPPGDLYDPWRELTMFPATENTHSSNQAIPQSYSELWDFVQKWETGQMGLLNRQDLSGFIRWMELESLQMARAIAGVNNNHPERKRRMVQVNIAFYQLLEACQKLQKQLGDGG